MATEKSIHLAAQAWCTPETSGIEMDTVLATAFADIIDKYAIDEPLLGLATTAQLLDELKARAVIGGYDQYRTVDA